MRVSWLAARVAAARPMRAGLERTEDNGQYEVGEEGGAPGGAAYGSEQVAHHARPHGGALRRGGDRCRQQGRRVEGAARGDAHSRAQRAEGRDAQEDGEPQDFAPERPRQSDVVSLVMEQAPGPGAA